MLKFRKQYKIKTFYRNVLFVSKDDEYFKEITGEEIPALFIVNKLLDEMPYPSFYTMYEDGIPLATLAITSTSRKEKLVWFYVDKMARNKHYMTKIFSFIHKKAGTEFLTGTNKRSGKFMRFAEKNKWEVFFENDNDIIYKVCQ